MTNILLESFMQGFLPIILWMPYLFLFYFWYGKLIAVKLAKVRNPNLNIDESGEASEGLLIIQKIAFFAYLLIILFAIFEGKMISMVFLESSYIVKDVNPTQYWINFGIYSFYMFTVVLNVFLAKKKN